MPYDDIHNIVGKNQTDTITNAGGPSTGSGQAAGIVQKATTYKWDYLYSGTQPHAPTHIGNRTFTYDANGNQLGWRNDTNGTRRIILWDEDNRISQIDDNGERSQYTYDANGQRAIKVARQGETVYVNQYYVVRNRSIVSKHFYAGTSRIATRLLMGTAPGNNYHGAGGNPSAGTGQAAQGQGAAQSAHGKNANAGQGSGNPATQALLPPGEGLGRGKHDKAKASGESATNLPGNSEAGLENALASGQGHKYGIYKHLAKEGDTVNANGEIVSAGTGGTGTAQGQSDFTYYYHPDHLGSTGYVTDANGKLYEHLEYFPFGETWVQEHSNTLRTPYLFTGKEFDQETGLYYFGARYYDPRTSVWQSADPILGNYLSGKPSGGVYMPANLGLYSYTHNNPIIMVDPDGRVVIEFGFGLNLVVKGGVGFSLSAQFDTENYQLGVKAEGTARVGLEVGANFSGKISPSSGNPASSGSDADFFANVSGGMGPVGIDQDIGTVKLTGSNKGQASGLGDVAAGGEIKGTNFKTGLKFGASAGAGLRVQGNTDMIATGVAQTKQLISGGKQLISDTKKTANSLANLVNQVDKTIDTIKNFLNNGPKSD